MYSVINGPFLLFHAFEEEICDMLKIFTIVMVFVGERPQGSKDELVGDPAEILQSST